MTILPAVGVRALVFAIQGVAGVRSWEVRRAVTRLAEHWLMPSGEAGGTTFPSTR
jgi:hypothetical protein